MADSRVIPIMGKKFLELLVKAELISPLATHVVIEADMDGVLTVEETRFGGQEWLDKLSNKQLWAAAGFPEKE